MAKKSLLSSTSKKKTKAKKKDDVKKGDKAKAAQKKKTAAKSKQKAAKPKMSAAKSNASKKVAPKTGTTKQKPVSIKELLLKKFDTTPPKNLYSAPVDTKRSEIISPAFISKGDPEEIERIRKLLFKQFDLNTPEAKEEAPTEAPVKETASEPEAKPEAKKEAPAEVPVEETPPEPEAKPEAKKEAPAEAPVEKTPPEPEAKPEAKKEAPPEAPVEETPPEPEDKPEAKKEAPREKISVYEIPKEKALPFAEVTAPATASLEDASVIDVASHEQGDNNMQKSMVIAGACLAAVLILLIGVSFSNMGNFEIRDNEGTIEIWKGRFAPIGNQKIMTLEGMTVAEEMVGASSQTDAYTLIYMNYIQKADALLEKSGMPDYEAIRSRLSEAKSYAVTPEMKKLVAARLHRIDMTALLYKADISASKNTTEGLEAAKKYLTETTKLRLDPSEESLVNQKLQWIESQIGGMSTIKAEETPPTPAPPVEKAPKADH